MCARTMGRVRGPALALAAGVAVLVAGCSPLGSVGDYFEFRANDAADMVDLGVTWTDEPYFSVYACLLGLSSIGAGHVDGEFAGIGGGRVGVFPHYHKVGGFLVWTYEELGWDNFDVSKPETLYRWHNGPVGYICYPERKPAYGFS